MASQHHKDNSTTIIIIATLMIMIIVVGIVASKNKKEASQPKDDTTLLGTNPWVTGPAEAKVTIVEFADFDCSACYGFSQIWPGVIAQFPSDVRFVFRNFPLQGEQGASFGIAEAAEAAGAQGKYWDYHHALWQNYGKNTEENLLGIARELGLDVDLFASDLTNGTYKDEVLADYQAAQDLGLTATPSLYINGVKYLGSREPATLTAYIQNLLDQ